MSLDSEIKPLGVSEPRGPIKDFADYCEAELERRRDLAEPFDEAAFNEAVRLVSRKLQAIKDRGL